MAAPAMSDHFLSAANLSWFAVSVVVELMFLGIGITPWGMEMGARIADMFGLITPVTATAGVSSAVASTGVKALAF